MLNDLKGIADLSLTGRVGGGADQLAYLNREDSGTNRLHAEHATAALKRLVAFPRPAFVREAEDGHAAQLDRVSDPVEDGSAMVEFSRQRYNDQIRLENLLHHRRKVFGVECEYAISVMLQGAGQDIPVVGIRLYQQDDLSRHGRLPSRGAALQLGQIGYLPAILGPLRAE